MTPYKLSDNEIEALRLARDEMIENDFIGKFEFICLAYNRVARKLGMVAENDIAPLERAIDDAMRDKSLADPCAITFACWLDANVVAILDGVEVRANSDDTDINRRFYGQARIGWIDTMIARGVIE
jgi:hypothetical protein